MTYHRGTLLGDPGYAKLASAKNDTMKVFYQQPMHIRPGVHVSLGHFGRLAHEYWIDMWLKIESERLRIIKCHQKGK